MRGAANDVSSLKMLPESTTLITLSQQEIGRACTFSPIPVQAKYEGPSGLMKTQGVFDILEYFLWQTGTTWDLVESVFDG